jgi:Pyruvate/2-oxoacid:ferredoxin oxidoreductase gamma subunit
MSVTVHLRGVGGQALPFIVTLLGRRAADAGARLTSREVFGMAQRGGSVFAILEIEPADEAGLAGTSGRSVLLGFELLEGLRGFSVLRPGERAFVSTTRSIPPGSWASGTTAYPSVENITEIADRFGIDLTLVDAPAHAPWRVVQAAIDAQAIPLEAKPGR